MLTKTKLNDIWWSGFCNETVRQAATTEPFTPGAESRTRWLLQHMALTGCRDCINANVGKFLEMEAAQLMGSEAVLLWTKGGDITALQNFKPALATIIHRALICGDITQEFMNWWKRIVDERAGKDWPGLETVQTAQGE